MKPIASNVRIVNLAWNFQDFQKSLREHRRDLWQRHYEQSSLLLSETNISLANVRREEENWSNFFEICPTAALWISDERGTVTKFHKERGMRFHVRAIVMAGRSISKRK